MSFFAPRTITNPKGLAFVAVSLLFLYLGQDVLVDLLSEDFGLSSKDRMKREAENPEDKGQGQVIDESVVHYEDEADPSQFRYVRKVLNESESFVEEGGTKRPIPSKDLNKNYKEAKAAFFAPKPTCVPKPPPSGGDGGGEAAAPPPPAERRRKRADKEKDKLPYCEDLKKNKGEAAPAAEPPAAAR